MLQRTCRKCGNRHAPPTGKKCPFRHQADELEEAFRDENTNPVLTAINQQLKEMREQVSELKQQIAVDKRQGKQPGSLDNQSTENDMIDACSGQAQLQNEHGLINGEENAGATDILRRNAATGASVVEHGVSEGHQNTADSNGVIDHNSNENSNVGGARRHSIARQVHFSGQREQFDNNAHRLAEDNFETDLNGGIVQHGMVPNGRSRQQFNQGIAVVRQGNEIAANHGGARPKSTYVQRPASPVRAPFVLPHEVRNQRIDNHCSGIHDRQQVPVHVGEVSGQYQGLQDYGVDPTSIVGVASNQRQASARDDVQIGAYYDYHQAGAPAASVQDYGGFSAHPNGSMSRSGATSQNGQYLPGGFLAHPSRPVSQGAGVPQDGHCLPTVNALRNNQHISDCVSQRLADFGLEDQNVDNNMEHYRKQRGKKSGLQRTVEDQVVNEIDWPHLYIYRGQDRKPTHYGELTLAEFVFGFLSMVDNPRNEFDRPLMLSILKDMMLDTTQYGWYQIRNYYRILASGIEMARYSWSDSLQISSIRSQYAQRQLVQNYNRPNYKQNTSSPNNTNIKVCVPFQTDECSLQDGHDGYLHICAYCYTSTGMVFRHKEKDCRRKLFSPKNGAKGGL